VVLVLVALVSEIAHEQELSSLNYETKHIYTLKVTSFGRIME
jgi:hypothetical protein